MHFALVSGRGRRRRLGSSPDPRYDSIHVAFSILDPMCPIYYMLISKFGPLNLMRNDEIFFNLPPQMASFSLTSAFATPIDIFRTRIISSGRNSRPRCCAAKSATTTTPPAEATIIPPLVDRNEFPILQQKIHDDKPLVYLDSAATSQKPMAVIDALTDYYSQDNSNVHRGAHTLAARATDAFERTRGLIAKLLNAADSSEIVYTRNATEAINLVASTWGLSNVKAGDKIIVSAMEHHANLVPWQILAKRVGAQVIAVRIDAENQSYDTKHLKQLLDSGGVKLVACCHVSNVLGCENPVHEIVSLAHEAGAVTLIDACQSVPHMRVDVQSIGTDFLVASSHKMLGPTGVGFLYGRRELLDAMPPYMGGGEMIADVFLDDSTYAEPPHKFEAGTPPIGEVIAFGTAIDYLNDIGLDKVHDFELSVAEYLYKSLTQFEEVEVYGPAPPRASLCAFNVKGIHSSDLATMLDLDGVAVRSGHHCAQPLHRELGVTASARASLYIYNSTSDVDALIESLKEAVDILGGTLTAK